MTPLLGLTLNDLQTVAAECGLPRFAAKQMAAWLYKKRVTSIDEMTDISLRGREALKARYIVGREAPLAEAVSTDGTAKYLFNGAGSRCIESVFIPDRERATLCVSSQAGCKMGCTFCMTGRQGFHGNLTSGAIINQVLSVPGSERLTNIVFMGMGEPLDNLDNLLRAIEILTAPWGLAWSPRRITVSSIGKLDALRTLIEQTQVHVAISVHSPFSAERAELMPIEKGYALTDIMALLRQYDWRHQRRLSVEYIMWRGLNDDLRHARALARLLKGTDARVNLIRFHAIPDSPLRTASEADMTAFRDALNDMGVTATIRASRGEDIMAACGMLAGGAPPTPPLKGGAGGAPVFLIGYMGCGKSTLGRALGRATGVQFIDLDTYIERRFHANVRDIFARDGEEAFRDMERRMLREVGEFENVIVACGGGTPCFFDNLDYMNSRGTTVWLDAGLERTYTRLLAGRYKRPSIAHLTDEQLREHITRAIDERRQYYSRAKVTFDSSRLDNYDQIAESVQKFLKIIPLTPQ